MTQAIDHERSPNLRASWWDPRDPGHAVDRGEKTGMCPVYRALLRSTYGKNFRVDCLVFRISERPRVLFLRHDTYNVLLSRFVDTDGAVTKNNDTKERYVVGDESPLGVVNPPAPIGFTRAGARKNSALDTRPRNADIYFIITRCAHDYASLACIMTINLCYACEHIQTFN